MKNILFLVVFAISLSCGNSKKSWANAITPLLLCLIQKTIKMIKMLKKKPRMPIKTPKMKTVLKTQQQLLQDAQTLMLLLCEGQAKNLTVHWRGVVDLKQVFLAVIGLTMMVEAGLQMDR